MKQIEMKTQENDPPPSKGQIQIELNGSTVWADPPLIGLLTELNKAGLITRSHCAHDEEHTWVAIRMDNVNEVILRNDAPYNEVIIQWNRKR